MKWQMQWAGTQMVNQNMLVYPDEYDEPQPQLMAIIIPPDPMPITNARPEQYDIDEQQRRFEIDGQVRLETDGDTRLQSNLQSGNDEQ